MIQIHQTEPEGFVAQMQAAACYVEIDGRLLLLQQPAHKQEPGRWGVPAGKIEPNETPENAAKRELFEETGIAVERASQVESIGALYMQKPGLNYIFHMFRIRLDQKPEVRISDEHQGFQWAPFDEMGKIPLMAGAKEALEKYRGS